MPARLPDLHPDRPRGREPARADPTDARPGGAEDRADGVGAGAPGLVPRLPRLRDGVPERRRLPRTARRNAGAPGGDPAVDGAGPLHAVAVLQRLRPPGPAET